MHVMSAQHEPPTNVLYLVPTPIGNREDITLRALRILTEADIIACEDTRTTSHLLSLYGITGKRLVSCHEHNEQQRVRELMDEIESGKSVAYCSDAGMPAISDPGYRVVHEAIMRGVTVVPLPGASASLTALMASGLPTDEFLFAGFAPHKKGRKTFLEKISQYECTVIMYESPYRITKLLEELEQTCGGERNIVIARELTKMFEEFVRGSITEVKQIFLQRQAIKGEFVVILQGKAR